MFAIETQTGVKNMSKENSIWNFNLNGASSIISGKLIAKRSYERMGVNI
jgi:RNase P/RNase MRP subunit p29